VSGKHSTVCEIEFFVHPYLKACRMLYVIGPCSVYLMFYLTMLSVTEVSSDYGR